MLRLNANDLDFVSDKAVKAMQYGQEQMSRRTYAEHSEILKSRAAMDPAYLHLPRKASPRETGD